MRAEDYLKQSIYNYPSLNKDETYVKSKLKVLGHIFFCNGNGLDFARPKDLNRGGFIVDAKHYRRNGDWLRKIDLPYGREKFDVNLVDDQYFLDKIYRIRQGVYDQNARIINVVDKVRENGEADPMIRITGVVPYEPEEGEDPAMQRMRRRLDGPNLSECSSLHPYSPYPFSSGYFMLEKVYDGTEFLQHDWMVEAMALVDYTIEYFNTEELFIGHSDYPSESRITSTQRQLDQRLNSEGEESYQKLRKIWGYKEGQTVEEKRQEIWIKSLAYYTEFLQDFKKKFSWA